MVDLRVDLLYFICQDMGMSVVARDRVILTHKQDGGRAARSPDTFVRWFQVGANYPDGAE